jgi:hypothetical protein
LIEGRSLRAQGALLHRKFARRAFSAMPKHGGIMGTAVPL